MKRSSKGTPRICVALWRLLLSRVTSIAGLQCCECWQNVVRVFAFAVSQNNILEKSSRLLMASPEYRVRLIGLQGTLLNEKDTVIIMLCKTFFYNTI